MVPRRGLEPPQKPIKITKKQSVILILIFRAPRTLHKYFVRYSIGPVLSRPGHMHYPCILIDYCIQVGHGFSEIQHVAQMIQCGFVSMRIHLFNVMEFPLDCG